MSVLPPPATSICPIGTLSSEQLSWDCNDCLHSGLEDRDVLLAFAVGDPFVNARLLCLWGLAQVVLSVMVAFIHHDYSSLPGNVVGKMISPGTVLLGEAPIVSSRSGR